MKIVFPGYPTEIGKEHIEFPSDMEMLMSPMFSNAPLDYFLRHATPFQKDVIRFAPLSFHTKYIYVSSNVRYVYPGILLNPIIHPNLSTRNEWHPDGIRDRYRRVHICTNYLGTEFAEEALEMEIPDDATERYVTEKLIVEGHDLKITPMTAPTNRIVSYNDHLHRAPLPRVEDRGIRMFIRIMETNVEFPVTEQYFAKGTNVWRGTEAIANVMQRNGEVSIKF